MLRSNLLDGIRRAHSETYTLRMEKGYYENIFRGINEIIVGHLHQLTELQHCHVPHLKLKRLLQPSHFLF